jgi:hypothetical protein
VQTPVLPKEIKGKTIGRSFAVTGHSPAGIVLIEFFVLPSIIGF